MLFSKAFDNSEIISQYTKNVLITGFNEVEGKCVLITAKQIKHTVAGNVWWTPNQVYYTYLVTCDCVDDEGKIVRTSGNYPHMCYNWFHGSKIGHHLAVRAHIDCKGIKVRVGD